MSKLFKYQMQCVLGYQNTLLRDIKNHEFEMYELLYKLYKIGYSKFITWCVSAWVESI